MKVNIIVDEWYPFYMIDTEVMDHREIYDIPNELITKYHDTLEYLSTVQEELETYVKGNN